MVTLGTCGLNSTALCMASTAFISAVLSPRLDAISGENLKMRKITKNIRAMFTVEGMCTTNGGIHNLIVNILLFCPIWGDCFNQYYLVYIIRTVARRQWEDYLPV